MGAACSKEEFGNYKIGGNALGSKIDCKKLHHLNEFWKKQDRPQKKEEQRKEWERKKELFEKSNEKRLLQLREEQEKIEQLVHEKVSNKIELEKLNLQQELRLQQDINEAKIEKLIQKEVRNEMEKELLKLQQELNSQQEYQKNESRQREDEIKKKLNNERKNIKNMVKQKVKYEIDLQKVQMQENIELKVQEKVRYDLEQEKQKLQLELKKQHEEQQDEAKRTEEEQCKKANEKHLRQLKEGKILEQIVQEKVGLEIEREKIKLQQQLKMQQEEYQKNEAKRKEEELKIKLCKKVDEEHLRQLKEKQIIEQVVQEKVSLEIEREKIKLQQQLKMQQEEYQKNEAKRKEEKIKIKLCKKVDEEHLRQIKERQLIEQIVQEKVRLEMEQEKINLLQQLKMQQEVFQKNEAKRKEEELKNKLYKQADEEHLRQLREQERIESIVQDKVRHEIKLEIIKLQQELKNQQEEQQRREEQEKQKIFIDVLKQHKVNKNLILINKIREAFGSQILDDFPDTPFKTEKLAKHSKDYDEAYQMFRKNSWIFFVSKILRVDNPFLTIHYMLTKEKLKKHVDTEFVEEILFHGTKCEHLDGICTFNFDRSKVKTHTLGHGLSFATNSYFATHYHRDNVQNKKKVMVLAKVLTEDAELELGDGETTIPEEPSYTSTNDDMSVIVKYDDASYYPVYIIHYHGLHSFVNTQ